MKPPMFKMSADTRLIRQELAKLAVGETITYRDLGDVISKPVSGGTPALQSAMNSLLKEGLVFGVIRGVGYRRLNDHDIVDNSAGDIRSVRRKVKRGIRKLISVQDFSKMDPKHQLDHTIRTSVMTAMSDMTTNRGLAKVEKQVVATGRSSELPIRETLLAFMK